MLRMTLRTMALVILAVLLPSTAGVRAANVLFITAEVDPLDAEDAPLVTFLQGLGHTVTLLDDDKMSRPRKPPPWRRMSYSFQSPSVREESGRKSRRSKLR